MRIWALVVVATAALVLSCCSIAHAHNDEPIFLAWYGPFQPHGGTTEDSTAPLAFLAGIWHNVMRRHSNVPGVLPNPKLFSNAAAAADVFGEDGQEFYDAVLGNLSIPLVPREGERIQREDHRTKEEIVTALSAATSTTDAEAENPFRITFVGAVNHAIGFLPNRNVSQRQQQRRRQQQQKSSLPPTHITEFAASYRIATGQPFVLPHNPYAWLATTVDPTRVVVVCQASSPAQWALPFPKQSHGAALCPPVRDAVLARIGRLESLDDGGVAHLNELDRLDDQEDHEDDAHQPAPPQPPPAYWKYRLQQLDAIWVPTEKHRDVLHAFLNGNNDNNDKDIEISVVPTPIDTEIWRRGTEAADDPDLRAPRRGAATDSDEHLRNLQILQRIGQIPNEWVMKEVQQSSDPVVVARSDVFTVNGRKRSSSAASSPFQLVSFVPSAVSTAILDKKHDNSNSNADRATKAKFLAAVNERQDHAIRTCARDDSRIILSTFDWNAASGFDSVVRAFLQLQFEETTTNKGSKSNLCLVLRTGEAMLTSDGTGDEQILDFKQSLQLFTEFLVAADDVNVTQQQEIQDKLLKRQRWDRERDEQDDIDEINDMPEGEDRDARILELQNKPPPPPFPFIDRVLAARLALRQRRYFLKDKEERRKLREWLAASSSSSNSNTESSIMLVSTGQLSMDGFIQLTANSDLVVSLHRGSSPIWCSPVQQALAMSVPVIVSRACAPFAFLSSCAFTAESEHDALDAMHKALIETPIDELKRMGIAGRKFVVAEQDVEVVGNRVAELAERVAARRAKEFLQHLTVH